MRQRTSEGQTADSMRSTILIIMPQKSNIFSSDRLNAPVNCEHERAAFCESVSENPFADQGAHCRPWTPASLLRFVRNEIT